MKISNSKKQLAKIINENGGWREGAEFSAQDSSRDSSPGRVCFYINRPALSAGSTRWRDGGRGVVGGAESCITRANVLPNWHQTILSRDEYFYLYPAPVKVVVENKTTYTLTVTEGLSIEQLAADYRNAKDYAERKQQEADVAKADAEAKLAAYIAAAGSAVGLVLSVGAPELMITDWRELQENDWVWYGGADECPAGEYRVLEVEEPDYDGCRSVLVDAIGDVHWIDTDEEWRFIRRPAKEVNHA